MQLTGYAYYVILQGRRFMLPSLRQLRQKDRCYEIRDCCSSFTTLEESCCSAICSFLWMLHAKRLCGCLKFCCCDLMWIIWAFPPPSSGVRLSVPSPRPIHTVPPPGLSGCGLSTSILNAIAISLPYIYISPGQLFQALNIYFKSEARPCVH